MPTEKPHTHRNIKSGIAAATLSLLILGFALSPMATAVNYQAEINALNAANAQTQSSINELQVQASNYQQAITQYQQQINDIQTSINANQAQLVADQNAINVDEAKVTLNKSYLSDDLKTMYVSGQMSTIEELATSNNLSTFVNKQEDDIKVQDQLNNLVTTIKNLQQQAQDNKVQISALLQTEQSQEAQITSDQNQVNQLLGMNTQQQSAYNAQLAANNNTISQLQAAQAAANASVARAVDASPSGGSGGACDIGYGNGGYPSELCDAAQDSITDNAGFPNRECTSFANWYFTTMEHQYSFNASGNAGWWGETSNFPVSTFPDVQPGAIGIEPSSSISAPVPSLHGGYYGHVMIVLALPGTTYDGSLTGGGASGTQVPDGYVLVMSMNEDEAGHFMYDLWPDNYLMYINPNP